MASGRSVRCDVELGPAVGAAHIDGRLLPDDALRPLEPTDPKAVDLHQLSRMIDVEMPFLGLGTGLGLRCSGIAGHKAETLRPGVQPVTLENAVGAAG